MNARQRYLAVFDENKRNNLDKVPNFVQYLRPEFVKLHPQHFENKSVPFQDDFWFDRFKMAYLMGFESVFANVSPGLRVSRVEVEYENGEKVTIVWNGQPYDPNPTTSLGFYNKGLFFSMENLDKVRETLRVVDDSEAIKKLWTNTIKFHHMFFQL